MRQHDLAHAKAKRQHAAAATGAASGVDPLVMCEIRKDLERAGDTLSGTCAYSNQGGASFKGSRLISRNLEGWTEDKAWVYNRLKELCDDKNVSVASYKAGSPQPSNSLTKPGSAADDKMFDLQDKTEDKSMIDEQQIQEVSSATLPKQRIKQRSLSI